MEKRTDPMAKIFPKMSKCTQGDHVSTISCELPVEEEIHKVHLTEHVDQVEELTEDELVDIKVVGVASPDHVADHLIPLLPCLLGIHLHQLLIEAANQHGDLATLPGLPQEVGDVAHDGLECEHKDDPLVPGVPDLITLAGHLHQVPVEGGGGVGSNPGVRSRHPVSPC